MQEELDNIITLETDDGTMDVEVIEQTVIKGNTYLLVATVEDEDASTDEQDDEDECLILKDVSKSDEKEADYVIVEGDEKEEAYDIFMKILEKSDIELKK